MAAFRRRFAQTYVDTMQTRMDAGFQGHEAIYTKNRRFRHGNLQSPTVAQMVALAFSTKFFFTNSMEKLNFIH